MQKRIAIIFSTSEGQTEKIANHIAKYLRGEGEDVAVMHADEVPLDYTLDNSDAIIIGASIHMGKHQPSVVDYVTDHVDGLADKTDAFFSVSLSGENRHEEAERYIEEFKAKTGWEPDLTASFGGALRYRDYNFIKRGMMKSIAEKGGLDTDTSQNFEYTDWDEVDAFAREFLQRL